MRYIYPVLAFSSLNVRGAKEPVPLESVFGPVEKVTHMSPPWRTRRSRSSVESPRFLNLRRADNCVFPFEIVIVQDSTDSFKQDFVQMFEVQLPKIVEAFTAGHPGTKFSLVDFRDKPIHPFGVPPHPDGGYHDYCQKFRTNFSSNMTEISNFYRDTFATGGGDPPENSFGAMIAATQSNQLTWYTVEDATRLVIVSTDAPPHFEGSGLDRQGMGTFTGYFDDSDPSGQCTAEFYPTPDQVMVSLQTRAAYAAFLVYDPEAWNGLPGRSWQWFNRFIGQTDDFVQLNTEDSSDFWENLAKVIASIRSLECGLEPDTTEPTVLTTTSPASTGCPPCMDQPCPPCIPSSDCNATIFCEDGVYVNLGFRPSDINLKINDRRVEI